MYRHLRSEFSGALATLVLERPERRNAFSAELMREMTACAQALASRKDIGVVIVTGAGGVFSAGADLKDESRWAGGASLLEQREIAGLGYRMARAWEELPQVTIAAIEGYAIGGGLALAVALDWRVIARDAFVSLPEISLGIPLTWGTLPRLVNLLGPAKAKRLAILCERIGADEALGLGLVDHVCEPGSAMARAQALAHQVLDKPKHSVLMTKESVNAYAALGAHAVSYMALDQLELAAASPESRAAREAALRRSKPPTAD
jgi:enoyl-CoA hydratase/carnithine racemase